MKSRLSAAPAAAISLALACLASPTLAATFDITVDGPDAIYLAGRSDLVIPDPADAWPDGMIRHGGPTPEESQETFPPFISLVAGDIVKVLAPAKGCINFYNGFSATDCFGPEGVSGSASGLSGFGGISGYNGAQGSLVGVFLDDLIPDGATPMGLDYSVLGYEAASYAPGLGQVFFIGNGATGGGTLQSFLAPLGAKRLFFGIADGFGFFGAPGAYDDNDGAYRIRVGVNQVPQPPAVPLPASGLLLAGVLAGLGLMRRRQ